MNQYTVTIRMTVTDRIVAIPFKSSATQTGVVYGKALKAIEKAGHTNRDAFEIVDVTSGLVEAGA